MSKPPRRRKGSGPGNGRAFGKPRTPPPPETGLEAGYWSEKKREGAPLVFSLEGGATLRGVVREFDQDLIWIESDEGDEVTLRKREIRYLEEG